MRSLLVVAVVALALLAPVTHAQSTQWWLIRVFQATAQPTCNGDISLGLADQRPAGNCGTTLPCNIAGGISNSQGCVGTSVPSTSTFGNRVVVQARFASTSACTAGFADRVICVIQV